MKRITLLMLLTILYCASSFAQIAIGTQVSTSSNLPISGLYEYSYSQQLITQNDINAEGDITSISFFYNAGNTSKSTEYTILLGHTDKTAFTSTTSWILGSEMSQVFNGTVTYPVPGNQMLITFDAPFSYNNIDNLVIAVLESEVGYGGSISFGVTGNVGNGRSLSFRSDQILPEPTAPPEASSKNNYINSLILGGLSQSCLAPGALSVNNIALTSADISWEEAGTASEWKAVYGLAGFDPSAQGTTIAVSVNTGFSISGLENNTSYDVYVKSICAFGDESGWSEPLNFSTLCGTTTVPYAMDFETAVVPNIPACTSKENLGAGNEWVTQVYNLNGMSGKVLRYAYSVPNPADAWFYTQGLELEAGVEYKISYKYFGSANYPEKMKVAYGASPSSANMTVVLADHPNINSAEEVEYVFTVAANGVYYFGFNVYSNANNNNLYVDDIEIVAVAVCTPVTNLLAENLGINSADLSWTAGAGETAWEVLYGETGFDPASEGTSVEIDTNPETTLVGLEENTGYECYVRAICATNDKSVWTGPVAFSTLAVICDPTLVPYALDFEDVTIPALPECTTVQNAGNGNNWETAIPNEFGFNSKVLRYKYSTTDPGNTWFYTQGLELEAGVQYKISYKYGNNSEFLFVESMKVAYGTSADVAAMTNELADYPSITGGEPNLEEITFTVVADGVYYFGFNAYSTTNRFHLYLDDIMIDVAENSCDPATDVLVSDINQTSATVSWTAASTAIDGYDVEVYFEGEDPATITPQVTETVASGITTVDISGLNSNTSYDVYVISDCGDDNAIMSDVVNFTTTDLGVNSIDRTKINYFPNPVTNQLNITASGNVEKLRVTNLLGQVVMLLQPRTDKVLLDMSGLPEGTYIVQANIDTAVSTFKVIKK